MLLWEKLVKTNLVKESTMKEVIERMYNEGKLNLNDAVNAGLINTTEKNEIKGL